MTLQKIELAVDVACCANRRGALFERPSPEQPKISVSAASLLVSEVVTNALLHTSGPVTVEVVQKGNAYRICVGDGSPTPPTEKGYRADDVTGRGLPLLQHLAAAWGWKRTGKGKVVWFDVPEPLEDSATRGPGGRSYENPYPGGVPISLIGAPIEKMIRTAAHYDALYREFRLILELEPAHLDAIPGRLLTLIDELGSSFLGVGRATEESWDAAVRDCRDRVDLHFRLPPEAGPAIAHYNELLDEADEYCRHAELLTLAPAAETLAVRRWVFSQLVCQCQGESPTPWS